MIFSREFVIITHSSLKFLKGILNHGGAIGHLKFLVQFGGDLIFHPTLLICRNCLDQPRSESSVSAEVFW